MLIGRLESRRIGARSALGGRIRSVYNRGEARKILQPAHTVAGYGRINIFSTEGRANSDTKLPSSFEQIKPGKFNVLAAMRVRTIKWFFADNQTDPRPQLR